MLHNMQSERHGDATATLGPLPSISSVPQKDGLICGSCASVFRYWRGAIKIKWIHSLIKLKNIIPIEYLTWLIKRLRDWYYAEFTCLTHGMIPLDSLRFRADPSEICNTRPICLSEKPNCLLQSRSSFGKECLQQNKHVHPVDCYYGSLCRSPLLFNDRLTLDSCINIDSTYQLDTPSSWINPPLHLQTISLQTAGKTFSPHLKETPFQIG